MKFDLARRITNGKRDAPGYKYVPPAKYVCVVIGDNEASTLPDVESALNHIIPIIVIKGSALGNDMSDAVEK